MQRLRHVERLDLACRAVDVALAREEAAVEEHPDRLDRVQRNALGAREDLAAQVGREAGDEPVERSPSTVADSASSEIVVAFRPAAPKAGRRSTSSGRLSASTKIGWFRDHSSRYSMKSSRPASAHCRSSNTRITGRWSAIRSKKSRHAENRSSRSGAVRSARPSRCARRGSSQLRSSGSARAPRSRPATSRAPIPAARPRGCRRASAPSRRAPSTRRPRRRRGSGRDATRRVGETVDVLLELPGEPRLPDAGDPEHRESWAFPPPPMRGRAP